MVEKAPARERGKVCVREWKSLIGSGKPERKRGNFACGKERSSYLPKRVWAGIMDRSGAMTFFM